MKNPERHLNAKTQISYFMLHRLMGKLATVFCVILFLYVSTGCNESTILGQNLIPGTDHVNTLETDTFTIHSRTIYRPNDSVLASFQPLVQAGAINSDPVFGSTVAIPYLQVGLLNPGYTYIGTDVALDSAVLSLSYAGYYGDSMGAQTYTVYPINDPTFIDTLYYYTGQQISIDQNDPLGTATATAKGLKDSINNYGVMEGPQLRIRLSDAFGNSLLQQKADAAFTNDSAFHTFLNGLAIVPDSVSAGRNALLQLQMNSAYTGITVYYHNSTDDSLQAFFPFNVNTSAVTNYVRRNYSGTEVEQHFGDTSSVEGDSLIYLQNTPGLYANIEIPYLQNFPNAIINKAELIMTQISDQASDVFAAPDYLFLWKYKGPAQDTLGYIYDAGAVNNPMYGLQFSNLAYFGGAKKIITNENGKQVAQYRISITRYLQHLINASPIYNETNYGFRLGVYDASGSTKDIGRVVLGGGTNSNYRLKLHIVYTKIK